jgi:hypothetical protein
MTGVSRSAGSVAYTGSVLPAGGAAAAAAELPEALPSSSACASSRLGRSCRSAALAADALRRRMRGSQCRPWLPGIGVVERRQAPPRIFSASSPSQAARVRLHGPRGASRAAVRQRGGALFPRASTASLDGPLKLQRELVRPAPHLHLVLTSAAVVAPWHSAAPSHIVLPASPLSGSSLAHTRQSHTSHAAQGS